MRDDRWAGLLKVGIACGLLGAVLCLLVSFFVTDETMEWILLVAAWTIIGFSIGIDLSFWRTR